MSSTAAGEASRARIMAYLREREAAGLPPPTYREIGAATWLSAVAVAYQLRELKARGLVTYAPRQHRTIRVLRPGEGEAAP